MSQYIVSARKYRPDSFESLIGQDNIARTLKNSILRGQLAHAYLFCGPRGVGKTTTARIFAKMINCSHPTADMEPCGECESCTSFQEGRSYCIHELDAASNNGVEDIKALMDQVMVPPQVGKYSVYIIDEVHMLSTQAFNAFLKTLEEPPAHAIFILATTEKHKIIPTILSRCQTYDFNRISVPDIVRNLRDIAAKESVKIDDDSLHIIAKKADGAMRDALTIFDQTVAFCGTDIKYEDVMRNLNVLDYEFCFSLVRDFLAGDYGHALLTFDEILSKGFNALHFISSLSSHLRDLLVARTGGLETLLDLPDSLKKQYREQAQSCSVKFIYDALSVTTQCEAGYKASVNQRLHIEFALMKLCFLQNQPAAAESAPASAPEAGTSPRRTSAEPSAPTTPPPASLAVPPLTMPRVARSSEVSAAPSGAEDAAEAPKRSRAKTGASLSLSSLMNGGKQEQQEEKAPQTVKAASAISDEEIKAKWGELADTISQPRLASALRNAKLEIGGDDSQKVVSFAVMNDAQRKWIEENKLRELEAGFRSLTGCGTIRLEVGVVPDEHEGEKKVYMPVEKAQDLMQDNSEVRDLVVDLGLDIK